MCGGEGLLGNVFAKESREAPRGLWLGLNSRSILSEQYMKVSMTLATQVLTEPHFLCAKNGGESISW